MKDDNRAARFWNEGLRDLKQGCYYAARENFEKAVTYSEKKMGVNFMTKWLDATNEAIESEFSNCKRIKRLILNID